jgi:hypothetical protein
MVGSTKMWDLNLENDFYIHINTVNTFLSTIYKTRTSIIKICHLLPVSNFSHVTSVAWRNTGKWPMRRCWWLFGMFLSMPHLCHIGSVRPGFCHCRQDVSTSSTRHKKSHYYDQTMMRQVSHWYMQADTWGVLPTRGGFHSLHLLVKENSKV